MKHSFIKTKSDVLHLPQKKGENLRMGTYIGNYVLDLSVIDDLVY